MDPIVIFDLEYTTWQECYPDNWDHAKNQHKEIVQIAAAKVHPITGEIYDTFDVFTQPEKNPELSEYFTSLTNITQEDLAEALTIKHGLQQFCSWGEGHVHYSWGNDFGVVQENMKLHGLTIPFARRKFLDIRAYFALHGVPAWEYNSGRLYQHFDILMDNNEHNALHDVTSIAKSLGKLHESLDVASKQA